MIDQPSGPGEAPLPPRTGAGAGEMSILTLNWFSRKQILVANHSVQSRQAAARNSRAKAERGVVALGSPASQRMIRTIFIAAAVMRC